MYCDVTKMTFKKIILSKCTLVVTMFFDILKGVLIFELARHLINAYILILVHSHHQGRYLATCVRVYYLCRISVSNRHWTNCY